MSKYCAKCGARLEDDELFCPECGTKAEPAPIEDSKKSTAATVIASVGGAVLGALTDDGEKEAVGVMSLEEAVALESTMTVPDVASLPPIIGRRSSVPGKCPHCGAELEFRTTFCNECGKLAGFEPDEPVEIKNGCPVCGSPLLPGAKFCSKCRTAVTEDSEPEGTDENGLPKPDLLTGVRGFSGISGDVRARAGEMSFDLPDIGDIAEVQSAVTLLSPAQAAAETARSVVTRLKGFYKNPKSIIAAVVMLWLWIVFMLWNTGDQPTKLSKFGSWLTFAEGGLIGNLGQQIGGFFGKFVVMTGFMSLFGGGTGKIVRGVKQIAATRGLCYGITVIGAGVAMLLYGLFAGYAGGYGSMVAVFGAVLSLEALGGAAGFVKTMASSFTSRAAGDSRVLNGKAFKSLLLGLTGGFVLSAALSVLKLRLFISLIVIAVGVATAFAQKTLKDRKGAAA